LPPVLTYCTNLFPGESLADVRATLARFAVPLRERLGMQQHLPVGLYLAARACDELLEHDALARFSAELDASKLRVVTINAFPFGNFHGAAVKEKVFEPAWDEEPRRNYTEKAARILATWLPRGGEGSISTHSGYYKNQPPSPERDARVARAWLRTAIGFNRIQEETGKRIILSIEPEPFSRLETTDEIIQFLEGAFGPTMNRMAAEWSVSPAWLEGVARRHIGVCFDCCHQAVEFEDCKASLARLAAAGIQIGKIQASCAPRIEMIHQNGDAVRQLERFAEPRYLHQSFVRDTGGAIHRFNDLAPALDALPGLRNAEEIRTHFHVPIFLENAGHAALLTTRPELESVLGVAANATHCVEIETYTMAALPQPPASDAEIVECAAREWQFAASRI
jgi:hypothetical protein